MEKLKVKEGDRVLVEEVVLAVNSDCSEVCVTTNLGEESTSWRKIYNIIPIEEEITKLKDREDTFSQFILTNA